MTNEQKLLKLLQIAVENGWKNELYQIHIMKHEFALFSQILQLHHNEENFECLVSLNDLILDWEYDNLGFISGLLQKTDKDFRDIYLDMMTGHSGNILTNFHIRWISLPTSQRLNFLFETFKHLL